MVTCMGFEVAKVTSVLVVTRMVPNKMAKFSKA